MFSLVAIIGGCVSGENYDWRITIKLHTKNATKKNNVQIDNEQHLNVINIDIETHACFAEGNPFICFGITKVVIETFDGKQKRKWLIACECNEILGKKLCVFAL